MAAQEGSAGLVGKASMEGQLDFGSSASSAATGGRIGSNFISNVSGKQGLGLVKTLALAGVALIAYKFLTKGA